MTAFRDGQVTRRANRRTEGFTNAVQEIGYQGIRRGDLVIHSMDGFAGAIGVSDSDGKASPVVHAYRSADDTDSRFYAYLLRTLARHGYLTSLAKGIRERSTAFDAETFRSLVLPAPSLPVQKRVADFLDAETARIDALIENRRRVAELTEQRLTAEIDAFIGSSGGPVHRLRHLLARPLQYGANEAAEYDVRTWPRYVRTTDVDDHGNLRDETFRSLPPEIARPYMLHDGDLLFTRSGATVGKSFEYHADWGPACFAGYLIRATLDRSKAVPRYVGYFLRSTQYREQIAEATIQATIQNVSAERYGDLRLPVPDLSVQQTIAASLDIVTASHRLVVAKSERQIELLQERRHTLITAAVTGELDLGVAA